MRYNTLIQNLDYGSQNVDVAAVYINPNFVSGNLEHNIALISTKADMDVLAFAKIPCLDSIQEGANIAAYGWGYPTEGSTTLNAELQMAMLRYLELKCAPYHASAGITVDETMFCAGEHTAGGVGICKGDEGGPAIRPGFGTVHGIASFHMGCGKPFFGSVFVRVNRYTSWIEATTGTVKCIVDG